MLIDHVTLQVKAGKGGDGVVRWRREKGIPYGGPAGGDGGKGGDVYIRVIRDIQALAVYKHKKEVCTVKMQKICTYKFLSALLFIIVNTIKHTNV